MMPSSSSMTDNDKAESSRRTTNNLGLFMNDPENVAVILDFLTIVCFEGQMRDWLGTAGDSFWLPLLSLLGSRPVESPTKSSSKSTRTSASFERLESSVIKFLSKCCWGHPSNQRLLAEILIAVINQQRAPSECHLFNFFLLTNIKFFC